MIVSIIAAIGDSGQLGLENKMLWHLPAEFLYFKKITMGHHLIMGRKTFQSIGRPLPGRTTIVITKSGRDDFPNTILLASTPLEALSLARSRRETEVFICGGGEIYRSFLPLADRLYLSRIDFNGQADTYFPYPIDPMWLLESETSYAADDKNNYAWKAQIYIRAPKN